MAKSENWKYNYGAQSMKAQWVNVVRDAHPPDDGFICVFIMRNLAL